MFEYIFVGLVVFVVALWYFAPNMKDRGYYDPRGKKNAEANTSLVFLESDEDRAAEYEHRFSASRTGMHMDRRGFKVRRRR